MSDQGQAPRDIAIIIGVPEYVIVNVVKEYFKNKK